MNKWIEDTVPSAEHREKKERTLANILINFIVMIYNMIIKPKIIEFAATSLLQKTKKSNLQHFRVSLASFKLPALMLNFIF